MKELQRRQLLGRGLSLGALTMLTKSVAVRVAAWRLVTLATVPTASDVLRKSRRLNGLMRTSNGDAAQQRGTAGSENGTTRAEMVPPVRKMVPPE